jgi:hypothetical protein
MSELGKATIMGLDGLEDSQDIPPLTAGESPRFCLKLLSA